MAKLQTACSTSCTEGMVVQTNTPDVIAARAGVFEFLLINHPLDCPVCDKGGECPLQDFSYTFGPERSRMEFPRRVFDGEGVRGVEQKENEWLRGTARRIPVERDARGRLLAEGGVWSTAGGDVALTVDATLQAEAAEQSALYGYEQTVQSAFADVENALIAQQKTVQKLAAQKALVDALSEYSRLARLQYRGGYVPYSTVLQADQQLFPAQLTLAQDRAQVFGAAVSVYQALGGGWVTLADGMTTEKTPSRRADAAQAVQ